MSFVCFNMTAFEGISKKINKNISYFQILGQRSKWLSKALVDTEIFSLCKKPWLFFLGSVLLNKKSPDVFIEIVHLSKWEKLKAKKAWNFNISLFHHKCFPGNFEIFRLLFPKTLSWRLPLIYDKSYRELKKKKNLFLAFN